MNEIKLLEAIANGTFNLRRFTRKEQVGCQDSANRFLWLALLRAEFELSGSYDRDIRGGTRSAYGSETCPSRFLTDLSEPLPKSFADLADELGRFKDRGRESIVFDAGDGFVYKLRLMRPSLVTGYIAPLASVVYHNALFHEERYSMETIYEDEGRFYMVLRQPYVEIRLDASGYPIKPSSEDIRKAIYGLKAGLLEYERAEMEDDAFGNSSDSESDDVQHMQFYNEEYYVSDLQPGRNTVIDDTTGRVRFIDPRVMLNDPEGPLTPVMRYGRRCEDVLPTDFSVFS